MSRSKLILLLTILALIMGISCIEVFEFDMQEPERILTVEGFITTQKKVHSIRVAFATGYGPRFLGPTSGIAGLTVFINDGEGKIELLSDQGSGIYHTSPEFGAEVGKTYSLNIELRDGKRYISTPELVTPVSSIDSLTYQSTRIATTDFLNDEIGIQVTAHFRDPGDEQNFYYWPLLESDFVIITEPELYRLPPTHPTNPRGAAPKACCSRCFHKEIPSPISVNTVSDADFNGLYQRRVIAYVRDNGMRFKDTYRLDLLHLSISAGAHRFLSLVDQQLRLKGTVFDSPPANIRGNMLSLSDPEEQVLGYFFAADEKNLRLYIQKSKLDFVLSPQTTVPDDCRDFLQQANFPMPFLSVDPPADWDPGN